MKLMEVQFKLVLIVFFGLNCFDTLSQYPNKEFVYIKQVNKKKHKKYKVEYSEEIAFINDSTYRYTFMKLSFSGDFYSIEGQYIVKENELILYHFVRNKKQFLKGKKPTYGIVKLHTQEDDLLLCKGIFRKKYKDKFKLSNRRIE